MGGRQYRRGGLRAGGVRGMPGRLLRPTLLALLAWGVSGCALLEPFLPPASEVCAPQIQEIARLRQELAEQEAEIASLRAKHSVQAEVLTQTTDEAARAEVKLRRLATQADAASHLAEVEVALEAIDTQPQPPAARVAAQLDQVRRMLAAGEIAFARGDYGAAVEQAAQAQEIMQMLNGHRTAPVVRGAVEVPFQVPVTLRTRVESRLRRQPGRSSGVLEVLPLGTPLQAEAYHGEWLRVRTEDGKTGWIFGTLLEAPDPVTQ